VGHEMIQRRIEEKSWREEIWQEEFCLSGWLW
jgi:hypothetical protein